MAMNRELAELLRDMLAAGVIRDYALFGATAQMRYTEAVSTLEAIRVGDWPVQFIPAFNALTQEAMCETEETELDGVPIRVVRADHLGVIALSTGRPKDFACILALLESGAVSREEPGRLADRHGLSAPWRRFLKRFFEP